jgi:hypothetical protein
MSINGSNKSSPSAGIIQQQIPPIIDAGFRVFDVLAHAIYFAFLIFYKELRTIPMFSMNHINMIGLLTGIHYCIWIPWNSPSTGNAQINALLCTISEVFWALSKFARGYAILVLAIYRFVAVFRPNLFKKLVKSWRFTLFSNICMVWLVSAIIYMIPKFWNNTTYGPNLCIDGYSPISANSINYYIFTAILGYLLPTILTIGIYILIRMRLGRMGSRLDRVGPTSSITEAAKSANAMIRQKERRLAQQMFIINFLALGACIFIVFFQLNSLLGTLTSQLTYIRQLLRIGIVSCQAFVPIVSLIYSPVIGKVTHRIRNMFL